jgi:serine/threonine protein phosphatase PrpC
MVFIKLLKRIFGRKPDRTANGNCGVISVSPKSSSSTSRFGVEDFAASQFSVGHDSILDIGAASIRGRGHVINGESRQDSFALFETEHYVVCAVMDGVSSSENSEIASRLVASELEYIFNATFPTTEIDSIDSWSQVNDYLSKSIVRRYLAESRTFGFEIPDSKLEAREAAAQKFATTLELVVIDRKENEEGSRNFRFVTICGDGALFLQRGNNLTRLAHPITSDNKSGKKGVFALPACDSAPEVLRGVLYPTEALILCTDGVGDFFISSKEWFSQYCSVVAQAPFTYSALLDFISLEAPDAIDDQTAIIMRLR